MSDDKRRTLTCCDDNEGVLHRVIEGMHERSGSETVDGLRSECSSSCLPLVFYGLAVRFNRPLRSS